MKRYTFQIGAGTGDAITTLSYSEHVRADGLGEAIDKAKAITNLRPESDKEDTVCLLDEVGGASVWARPIQDVRS